MKNIQYILLAFILLFVVNCNLKQNIELRSGTSNNPDIEEPLTKEAEKYKNNLIVSNLFIEQLKTQNYEDIYINYISKEMKKKFTIQQLKEMNEKIFILYGDIVSFKPMQWYFLARKEKDRNLIYSIKIVHHGKESVYYEFVFDKNNDKTIVGFHIALK